MTVQFSNGRPSDELNGVEALHDDLMGTNDPGPILVVAVLQRTKRVLTDADTDDYPVIRISRIEPVREADREQTQAILDAAFTERTGKEQLDMPAEDSDAAFEAAAPEPPEDSIKRARRGNLSAVETGDDE